MLTFLWLTALTASIVSILVAVRIRAKLAAWTVFQSWNWMIAALFTLACHALVSLPAANAPIAVRSAATYLAATMLLTPLVTTLGARRPGIAPWHWFVVLPMVAVLQWPALIQFTAGNLQAPVELSGPASMGVIVVLVMSAGTMLGTHATGFALLYSMGILLLLAPVTMENISNSSMDAGGAILVCAALLLAKRNLVDASKRLESAMTTAERVASLWDLFGSLYGIAWVRRVQDRINQFAPAEKWTVRLTAKGFERPDGISPGDEELQQPVNAFIWVLARFADNSWLNSALNPQIPNISADRHN